VIFFLIFPSSLVLVYKTEMIRSLLVNLIFLVVFWTLIQSLHFFHFFLCRRNSLNLLNFTFFPLHNKRRKKEAKKFCFSISLVKTKREKLIFLYFLFTTRIFYLFNSNFLSLLYGFLWRRAESECVKMKISRKLLWKKPQNVSKIIQKTHLLHTIFTQV
jgi:hypothetical protein